MPNISQLKALTKERQIPLIIDATLTGSVGFNAKAHGVDVVIYSSTKLFATNGGAVGGLIVDTEILIGEHPHILKFKRQLRMFIVLHF